MEQKANELDFELLPPYKWPSKSPDLNPCDYSVWSELEATLHRRMQFDTLEEMKDHLQQEWANLKQQHIDNSIHAFQKRCRTVIEVEGGDIEHLR